MRLVCTFDEKLNTQAWDLLKYTAHNLLTIFSVMIELMVCNSIYLKYQLTITMVCDEITDQNNELLLLGTVLGV